MVFHGMLSEKTALKFWAFFLFLSIFNIKIQITSRITLLNTKRVIHHQNQENLTFGGIYKEFLKKLPISRGKKYQNKSQSNIFLRSLIFAGFSPLLRSREEKGVIFKLRKKRGFEIFSNIFFPLISSLHQSVQQTQVYIS